MSKPLFIPLRSEYYALFARREKWTEFRPYGARWNRETCKVGRLVTLSKGYGKKHRISGKIISFNIEENPATIPAWSDVYGNHPGPVACITIDVEKNEDSLPHHCHAERCNAEVPPRLLMCPRHWRMVPKALQLEVWKQYRKGQEVSKNPSAQYLRAAHAAILAVDLKERAKE